MSTVAFYAPMKSPTHDVPSGDRQMARSLMQVIGAQVRVELASQLRAFDGVGDADVQAQIQINADKEITRLINQMKGADVSLWVTYHNYYKAPDLIGPKVSSALGLSYVLIESTRAHSRLTGKWAGFANAAEAASDAADLIFYLTDQDRTALKRDRPLRQKLAHLRPFLPINTPPRPGNTSNGPILTAGMMRPGDKLKSYQIIADTLAHLTGDWQLEIAGDGPARPQIEQMMAPYGDRVRFLGQLDQEGMSYAYQRAALFLWPGVNEAYGMVYLEAQVNGLAVVAQDRPGVRDVVAADTTVRPEAGPEGLAVVLTHLLANPEERQDQAQKARHTVATHHLLPQAINTFWNAVTPLMESRP